MSPSPGAGGTPPVDEKVYRKEKMAKLGKKNKAKVPSS